MTSAITIPDTPHDDQRSLRVVVVVPAFNAGDTTRGIESARALRAAAARHGGSADIEFWYPTSTTQYDQAIRDAGFRTRTFAMHFDDQLVDQVMTADHEGAEFFTDSRQAGELLDLLLDELRTTAPDLVVYGFLPPVGVATQILGIPSACYSPFPADRRWVSRNFLRDVPDELASSPLGHLPSRVQKGAARLLSAVVPTTGFFRQPSTVRAGLARGWCPTQPNLFGMLAADAQLVNDLPSFYEGERMGEHIHLAGPLFNSPEDAEVPDDVREWFEQGTGPRVFVAMGSSGEKKYLLDAVEAVSRTDCTAVVLVPPHVATLDEARRRLDGPGRVLLTDAFVPAPAVNAMADVAVIHGGQGTVQTAVASGTPVVGVGMQWEQAGNLDKLVAAGSGIRIRRGDWAPDTVERALRRVVDEPRFRQAAHRLQRDFEAVDGKRTTGEILWTVGTARCSAQHEREQA